MVNTDVHGQALVITIDRPDKKNAVNGEVAQGIEAGIDQLESTDDLFVGILASSGDVFCAGADLAAINSGRAGDLMTERGGFGGLVSRDRVKPMIAAVDGPALAGGCELVLACDLVVASDRARFGIPEVKRSLVAAAGGLFRLPKKLPLNIAMELAMTGDPIEAADAHRWGLVNRLVADGEALTGALALAEQICANAPVAVRESRAVVLESERLDDKAAMDRSATAMGVVMSSEDFSEGLTAFLEKRQPAWKGR